MVVIILIVFAGWRQRAPPSAACLLSRLSCTAADVLETKSWSLEGSVSVSDVSTRARISVSRVSTLVSAAHRPFVRIRRLAPVFTSLVLT